MRLATLADALDRLEATSSRRTAVEVVGDLLAAAGKDAIEPVVQLLQGQLRPPYEGVETGVGSQLLTRVLAAAYETSEPTVARRYRTAGDLGTVAERLAPARRRATLGVVEAYRALLDVAKAAGAGSTEKKIALAAALLRRATAREAKYLVRILQGRLRLGVGDQTIMEAIAAAALGDGRKKAAVEHAYNVRSDLGSVARLAFAGGERALARVGPKPGIPVRPALAQRLRSAEEIVERLGTVRAEPKYDGFRLQLHRDGDKVRIFSRRLENVTAMFPDVAAALKRELRARRAIVEGEAVGYDPATGEFLPFQVTMTRKRKTGIAETAERLPVRLFAFDLLYADGENWIPEPQRARSAELARLLRGKEDDPILVTGSLTTNSAKELQDYFDEMSTRGLEGIMAKKPDAPYHPGARDYTWVKLKRAYQQKLRDTVDVVLVGYFVGRGKRAALGIGSLLAAVYDPGQDRFRTVAKIGSGLTEPQWRALKKLLDAEATTSKPRRVDSRITPDVWVEPKYVIEVLADEVTRSPLHTAGKHGDAPGYALRFPRVLNGVRSDKGAEEATTEAEIVQLAGLQRGAGSRAGGTKPKRATAKRPKAKRPKAKA